MPRTDIARNDASGVPTGTLLTWTNADIVNQMQVRLTGHELILVRNSSTTVVESVTVLSAPDAQGRNGDITAFSVPVSTAGVAHGGWAVLGPFPYAAWAQPDGYLYLDTVTANLRFAVVVLP